MNEVENDCVNVNAKLLLLDGMLNIKREWICNNC